MKNKEIITPIIMISLGIVLLIIPGTIITTVIQVFGAIIIASGVLSIINTLKNNNSSYQLVYGILVGILGIIFITDPEVVAGIIPLILGIWIILKSTFKLQFINVLKKERTIDWVKPLIINILMLILGIVLVFNPFKGAEALMRIVAIFILVYSVLDITNYILTRPKRVKVLK